MRIKWDKAQYLLKGTIYTPIHIYQVHLENGILLSKKNEAQRLNEASKLNKMLII